MTIPSSGPISISQISTDNADGYGLGYSLASYCGVLYDNNAGGVGVFPSTNISFSSFYGRRRVDAGSRPYSSTGSNSIVVPPYVTMTIYARAGGGGGGGGGGSTNGGGCNAYNGSSGNNGGSTTFGSSGNAWYLSPSGGSAGTGGTGQDGNQNAGPSGSNGADGAGYDGSVARASGGDGKNTGNGGGGGGGGAQTITLTNPALGGTGPTSGATVAGFVGSGGGGGGYGQGRALQGVYPYVSCGNDDARNGASGASGANGIITLNWTGD